MAPAFSVSRPREIWGSSGWPLVRPAWMGTCAGTIRHDAYEGLHFEVPVEDGGDARARLMVRAREIEQSLVILRQVLAALPDTPLAASLPDRLPASTAALGWVEAWRGPCIHWVATDERGEICARQDHRPELPELAGTRAGGARQHHPGLSGDQ